MACCGNFPCDEAIYRSPGIFQEFITFRRQAVYKQKLQIKRFPVKIFSVSGCRFPISLANEVDRIVAYKNRRQGISNRVEPDKGILQQLTIRCGVSLISQATDLYRVIGWDGRQLKDSVVIGKSNGTVGKVTQGSARNRFPGSGIDDPATG
jgi:hypothetical protein